jgi:transcriptional regulator with XRE-family HTH domain
VPYSDISGIIGELLCKRRKELKMLQEDVAKKSGIPRPRISAMENNNYPNAVTFDIIERWANALGLELNLEFILMPISEKYETVEGEK